MIRLVLFVWLVFPITGFAFINIESLRQNLKTGFYGSSGVSMMGSSGNVRMFRGELNSQNIYKQGEDETIFITSYKYGEVSKSPNFHKGHTHFRYAQQLGVGWQWETFGQWEFNQFQSLVSRTLAGGGLRSRLYDRDQTSFFLGLGTFYEWENIKNDLDQQNFRGNLYLSFRDFISEKLETAVIVYFQPSYKRSDDYRIRWNLGFEFHLSENFRWVNGILYSMDTRPPKGVQKEDISFHVGLNIEYGL